MEVQVVAKLRDGTMLEIGDEVETNLHHTCLGVIFVICEIHPYSHCESGAHVVVHVKGYPEKRIEGKKIPDFESDPPGIDANWFKKIP